MRLFFLSLLPLVLIPHAAAGLQWEKQVLDIQAEPLGDKATAIFRFTNTGKTTVTVTSTHASCGCTTPALDKRVYAPGESGELRAVYTYGDATGQQEKTVTVATTEPNPASYVLTLRVDIPGLFEIQPRFVLWQRGEKVATKEITIRALHPDLAHPVSLTVRDERFAATLQASDKDADAYTVAITPKTTDAAMFTSVIVATSAPPEKKRVISLFATVR